MDRCRGLRELLDSSENDQYEDTWLAELVEARWRGRELKMQYRVMPWGTSEAVEQWCVEATGIRTHALCGSPGATSLELHDEHPLLLPHNDIAAELYFQGRPRSAASVVGDLWTAHDAMVGTWLPFGDCLNTPEMILEILKGGYGLFSSGPKSLMECYASVLTRHGLRPTVRQVGPAQWWNGMQWLESDGACLLFLADEMYVVASRFTATRM